MKHIRLVACLLFLPAVLSAQEIKTKVTESQFDVKPDAVKEEQFDEATTFAYVGLGWARRTGPIMAGFLASSTTPNSPVHRTSTDDVTHRSGMAFDLGFRHYLDNRFGFGVRGGMFVNNTDFQEQDPQVTRLDRATANTRIFDLMAEGLYRHYLSGEKTSFVYGGLGLGWSSILQSQQYRFDRETTVSTGFFSARPTVGIQVPWFDIFHVHAETGYLYSAGSIPDGDLSLSRFQLGLGLTIRLNSF